MCGDLGCARDRLLALLWPEADEAHSRHGLRDTLHVIRRELGLGAVPFGGQVLRLDPAVVVSDVRVFAQALSAGELATAVETYGGPLLDGVYLDRALPFEQWVDAERARLARDYAEALQRLATEAERTAAWQEAVGWWARAVDHDPLNSHLVLRAMHAMAAIGDRANAVMLGAAHVRRFREELEVEPDPAVVATTERIRRGEEPLDSAALSPPGPGTPDRIATARQASPSPDPPGVGTNAPQPASPGAARMRSRRALWAVAGAAGLVLLGALWAESRPRAHRVEVHPPLTAIAVLPFRSLSTDPAQAYFAVGLHDEVLAQLARVASLRVIARTSVAEYAQTSKPPRQIAAELGVGSVVEGSVQIVGGRLRAIVQLFDATTGTELWAQHYDRALDSVFTVQSEIARQIVAAVGVTLTNAQRGTMERPPTGNAQAYEFYLKGREYARRAGDQRSNLEVAQQLYERALALDSGFALAHAALSSTDWLMYDLAYDPSSARVERARREAETALRLAPDLPQAHLAVGLARDFVRDDYRAALEEFTRALQGAPNDAELWAWIARAHRGLGNWDSAVVAFERARRRDPLNANLSFALGSLLHSLHRYPDAIAAYRRTLALAPDFTQARIAMGWSYVLWKGELDTLRAALRLMPVHAEPAAGGTAPLEARIDALLFERRPDSVLALLRQAPETQFSSTIFLHPRAEYAAEADLLRGDSAAARAALDSAAALLDAEAPRFTGDWRFHAARGRVLAALGHRAAALREADWLDRWPTYHQDHYLAPWVTGAHAAILAEAGDTAAALADIERLLAGPSYVTVHELRLDPTWDPIRGDPRFQALLAIYAEPRHGVEDGG